MTEGQKKMKNIAIVVVVALMACGPMTGNWGTQRVQPEVAHHSVYRIKAELILDKSTKDAETGEVTAATDTVAWRGSAWVVGHRDGDSTLMTAGHVCWTEPFYETTDIDWINFKLVKTKVPVVDVKYTLTSFDGTDDIEGAQVILDDDNVDLCSLKVKGDLGTTLAVGDTDPKYDEQDLNISAPRGFYGKGVAPAIPLTFSGRGKLFNDDGPIALFWTGLGDHGSSGSPIFSDGMVVAVLTQGTNEYTRLVSGVPHEVIRKFLRLSDSLYDYDVPFHMSPKK